MLNKIIDEEVKLNLNDLEYTHDQWYLSDPLNPIEFKQYYLNNNVYLISALGTGKTELLREWIDKHFNDSKMLYVSFRKSLTSNILSWLNMESYENISGQIDMNVHKRIAIQVESINRIKNIEQV